MVSLKDAVLVALGDELLSGIRREGNCSWMASRLHRAGWKVRGIEILPDDPAVSLAALRCRVGNVRLLVISGGLGPTHDDRTRDILAELLGVPLIQDDTAYDRMAERYSGEHGIAFERSRSRQAAIPEGTRSIHNPLGSALGIHFEHKGTEVFSFPGVPTEYRAMAEASLGDRLEPEDCWVSVSVTGWAESLLKDEISDVLEDPSMHTSILPAPNLVEIVLRGSPERIRAGEETIRERLPHGCLPHGCTTLQQAVVLEAGTRGVTVAAAESCTGGLVGAAVTEVPGSSGVFMGSAVCYDNRIKRDVLGVPADVLESCGAVSAQCANAMASGACRVFGVDVAVSVTGIAGPGGGSPEKPVGTVWFAVSDSRTGMTREFTRRFNGDREMIRERSKAQALELLWRGILGDMTWN